jgi:hypothetical protein
MANVEGDAPVYEGSCQCGAVRFTARTRLEALSSAIARGAGGSTR